MKFAASGRRTALVVILGLGAMGATVTARAAESANGAPANFSRLAAETWLSRARVRRAQGDTAAAIAAYTEVLRIDPGIGAAYLELAEIRSALGDLRQSELLLSRATTLLSVRPRALLQRAALYLASGRTALAADDFEAAVEARPDAETLRALGMFYVRQRAYVAALAVWRRLLTIAEVATDPKLRREELDTAAALARLAAESDAVQNAADDRNWVRRTLRRHAIPRDASRPRAVRRPSASAP